MLSTALHCPHPPRQRSATPGLVLAGAVLWVQSHRPDQPGASGCVQALLCPASCSWAAVWEQAAARLSCPGLSTDLSPVPTPVSLPSPQCSRRGQTCSICPATTVLDVPGQLACRQPSGRRSSLPAELPFNKWLWRWVPGAVGVLVPCCAASPGVPQDAAGSPPQQAGGPR